MVREIGASDLNCRLFHLYSSVPGATNSDWGTAWAGALGYPHQVYRVVRATHHPADLSTALYLAKNDWFALKGQLLIQ